MKKAIILVFMVYVTTVAYGLLQQKDFGPILTAIAPVWHKKCQLYTGVPETLIDELKLGKFPEEDSLKRYVTCIWTHSDLLMDEHLNLYPEKVRFLLPSMHKEDAVHYLKCNQDALHSGEKNPVEIIWTMEKCIQKTVDDEHYISF